MKVKIINHTPGTYLNRYQITIDDGISVQRWVYMVLSDVDICSTLLRRGWRTNNKKFRKSCTSWQVLEEYTLPGVIPMDLEDPAKTIITFKKLVMLQ